jgi:hypothetical protein
MALDLAGQGGLRHPSMGFTGEASCFPCPQSPVSQRIFPALRTQNDCLQRFGLSESSDAERATSVERVRAQVVEFGSVLHQIRFPFRLVPDFCMITNSDQHKVMRKSGVFHESFRDADSTLRIH